MPALTSDAADAGAGVRKPAGKEPAGGLSGGGGRIAMDNWALALR